MSSLRLSICIPTFRNPRGIDTALRTIAAQAQDAAIAGEVEVCISDNSEDRETEQVVASHRDSPVRISYVRNEHNVGYDRNVDRVLNQASGDFCWLLSDDEPLGPHAVSAVYQATLDTPDAGHIVIAPYAIAPTNLRRYENLEAAILANNQWIPGGLVSRNIFARHLLPTDRARYFGNYWLHLSLAFEMGATHPVHFIAEQFTEDTDAVCRWARDGATLRTYTSLLTIIATLPPPYTDALRHDLASRMRRRLPREILSAKLYGLRPTRDAMARIRHAAAGHPLIMLASLAALITPVALIRYAKRLKHYARH